MTIFWVLAVLLAFIAAGFVLVPMRLASGRTGPDRSEINVAIYKDRLAELDESRSDGSLDDEDYEHFKRELEQTLLVDVDGSGGGDGFSSSISRPGVTILTLTVPLIALLLYSGLGSIRDVELAEQLRQSSQDPHGASAMASTMDSLYERLQTQLDNDQGWFLLGRSAMEGGNYRRAVEAFAHLVDRFPEDPSLHTYLANSLYLGDGRQFSPRVSAAVEAGLELDPGNVDLLQLRGMGALQRGNTTAAIEQFQSILARPGIGQQRKMYLERLIEQAGGTVAGAPVAAQMPGSADATSGKSVEVMVELADGVGVSRSDTVFVFARAVNGPPMPLAAQRLTVADLPARVLLDESMAMNPAFSLATASEVQVVARITMDGGPSAKPGDWEAVSSNMTLEQGPSKVSLLISKQIPE